MTGLSAYPLRPRLPMTAPAQTDYFGLTIPFMSFIGLVPESIAPAYARTSLPWR